VTDYIEVVFALDDLVEIEIGRQNALASAVRFRRESGLVD